MAEVHELQKRVLEFQNSEKVKKVFSKMISGREDYETIVEMKKEPLKCKNCKTLLCGDEKFCPECGTKIEKPQTKK